VPKSKHRRKLGGKAAAHPGRGKTGPPPILNQLPQDPAERERVAAERLAELRKLSLLAPLAGKLP
jgi:hypothetical protein